MKNQILTLIVGATVLTASPAFAMEEQIDVDVENRSFPVTQSTQPSLTLAERERAKRAERNRAKRAERKRIALAHKPPIKLAKEEFNALEAAAEKGDDAAQVQLGHIYRFGARFTQGEVGELESQLGSLQIQN